MEVILKKGNQEYTTEKDSPLYRQLIHVGFSAETADGEIVFQPETKEFLKQRISELEKQLQDATKNRMGKPSDVDIEKLSKK